MSSYLKQWLTQGLEEHKETVNVEGEVTEVTETSTTAEIEATDLQTDTDGTEAPVSDEQVTATEKPAGAEDANGEVVSSEETQEGTVTQVTEATTTAEIEASDIEEEGDGTDAPESDDMVCPKDDGVVTASEEAYQQVAEDFDSLMRINDSLEAYTDLLSTVLDASQGINPVAAEAIRIGIEGLDSSFKEMEIVPGLEAFGAKETALSATQISLENAGDALKKVGRAALAAFKKLMTMLADLWDDIFNRYSLLSGSVQKTLEELKKKKSQGATAKESTITVKGLGDLSIDFDYSGRPLNLVQRNIRNINGRAIDDMLDVIQAEIFEASLKHKEGKFEMDLEKVYRKAEQIYTHLDHLPGGRKFVAKRENGQFAIEFTQPKLVTEKAVEIKVPSLGEIELVLKELLDITSLFKSNRQISKKYKDAAKTIESKVTYALNAPGYVDVEKRVSTALVTMRKLNEVAERPARDFNKYVYRLVQVYLLVSKRLLAQYAAAE